MSKVLLIGGIGAGKTSLKQKMLKEKLSYRKTQMLEFSDTFIDCPGEYLEIPRYYHVIIDISHRVSEIWALQDATKSRCFYPPNFAKVYKKPVIGVITKIDSPQADIEKAILLLRNAGIEDSIYQTSTITEEGCDALRSRLEAYLSRGRFF